MQRGTRKLIFLKLRHSNLFKNHPQVVPNITTEIETIPKFKNQIFKIFFLSSYPPCLLAIAHDVEKTIQNKRDTTHKRNFIT